MVLKLDNFEQVMLSGGEDGPCVGRWERRWPLRPRKSSIYSQGRFCIIAIHTLIWTEGTYKNHWRRNKPCPWPSLVTTVSKRLTHANLLTSLMIVSRVAVYYCALVSGPTKNDQYIHIKRIETLWNVLYNNCKALHSFLRIKNPNLNTLNLRASMQDAPRIHSPTATSNFISVPEVQRSLLLQYFYKSG